MKPLDTIPAEAIVFVDAPDAEGAAVSLRSLMLFVRLSDADRAALLAGNPVVLGDCVAILAETE